MTSFALGILFLFNLILGIAMGWIWVSLRQRQKELEQKLLESIDDQDLSAFQDSVQELIRDLRLASDDGVQRIENSSEGLDTLMKRAETLDRRLAKRIENLEKGQEKLEKALSSTIEKSLKKTSLKGKGKKTPDYSSIDATLILQALGQTPSFMQKEGVQRAEIPEALLPKKRVQVPEQPEGNPREAAEIRPRDKVVDLSKKGLNKQEIAAATGLLPGEIELILNLRAGSGK